MDSQTILWYLLDAIDRNDRETVCDYIEYLGGCIKEGGSMPTVDRVAGVNGLFQVRRKV